MANGSKASSTAPPVDTSQALPVRRGHRDRETSVMKGVDGM